ncbi:hypothetical protein M8J77_016938 [Diaphorina citri]|nr:hypothetical protein M8J77_016938 [Diaphorina citri]
MLNNPSWGLNRSILLKIYNSYCRPITDYGSIVYQSAKPSAKGKLNSTHNNFISSLSIALGDNTNNLTNVISFLKDIDLYKHI